MNTLNRYTHKKRRRAAGAVIQLLSLFGILLTAERAAALGTEHAGPDTNGQATFAQPGWYKGMIEPLKHPSRVYSVWVNGDEQFYFKATPEQINELISLYSRAHLRDHEIVIKPGAATAKSFFGTNYDYNVSIQTLEGIALGYFSGQDATKTFEPQMTIQAGDDPLFLAQLRFPENVIVRSEIPGVPAGTRTNLPARKAWYGRISFEGDAPVTIMMRGLATKLTLWDEKAVDGIPLPGAHGDGYLKVALSDEELAALKDGKSWLTLTTGNFAAVPKKTDARFPADLLVLDKDQAKTHELARPQNYFYGRILFEDGTPPVLSPKPWPGAEVAVDFAYAGRATPDAEGYFQVFLDPDQFARLKQERPRTNIYCPSEQEGRSTAAGIFPPELLSQDQGGAAVVKIAKPQYMTSKTQ